MSAPGTLVDHLSTSLFGGAGSWEQRLVFILETMREMSRQTDPQVMVQMYGRRMREILPADGFLSLSRRDLIEPRYRITRSSKWEQNINPWLQKDRLPMLEGGLLAQLIYGNEPVVIDELDVPPDDPAAEHLAGMGSLLAIPLFDQGVALNMVVRMRREPHGFSREKQPEYVWMSNLFGRATQNLVLSGELRRAYEAVDRELKAVADIQTSLLPTTLPIIPGLELAAHYQTSRRAGGDYYDFFPLPNGHWGILIADVSGHGTPAAVLMAITHSIAHMCCEPPAPPGKLLAAVNRRLSDSYTTDTGNFVTAFYGVFDPVSRKLLFASAGHPQPRIRSVTGCIRPCESWPHLPLGIDPEEIYHDAEEALQPGETILFYTDGITEARNAASDLFVTPRLDQTLSRCDGGAADVIREVLAAIDLFAQGQPASDDRTLLAAKLIHSR